MLIEKPRIPLRDILLYGLLPGFLKILIYRLKGYQIGKGVSIGFGSVLLGDLVTVGDHTSIGFFTIVRGKEIRLGRYVQIGSLTFLDTPYIDIGEGSKINEQVFVGGLQFPDSRFVLGRNCQIMQLSFINPARSVVVGDDTGIGGHCLIFGHTSWLSQLEGYPVEFQPVEIGRSVSLAWRVFVLPGAKIGDGAVVGANSVVHRNVPPHCLAVGFPARVVQAAPDFPKQLSDEERLEIFRGIVAAMIDYFTAAGLQCAQGDSRYEIHRPGRRSRRRNSQAWVLEVVENDVPLPGNGQPSHKAHVLVSFREIPEPVRATLESIETVWIDIAKKERSDMSNDLADEVSLFLRRYGVRTLRVSSPRV